ncbi:MAG TPA: ABC transporter permease [Bacteroidia bacterium]|jgi:lipopolysaccharide transport system permease protein|nr:ABC transporter permease [Bacteroidia bacterium]
MTEEKDWDIIIKPKPKLFHFGFKEIWAYRDLIILFVKRDIVSQYKQTILGPLWLIIQPILTTVFFTIIFGKFAKFDTGGIPFPIFTLSGLTIWNFFAMSLNKTSSVFVNNATIFGKVYFPRLTVPFSAIIANFITFLVQFAILLLLLFYYKFFNNYVWQINYFGLLGLLLLLIIFSLFGLGAGLIVSSITTKYRDLGFLVGFALQFVMYFSSVVFPLDKLGPKWGSIINLNPLIHLVHWFRAIIINAPMPNMSLLLYSTAFMIIVLFSGILVFNRVEKSFMDTV